MTVTNPGNSATGSGAFSDSAAGPPLDADERHLDLHPQHRVDVRAAIDAGSHRIAERRADHGGPQRRHRDVRHHRHHPASGVPVTVHNVGSVTPGPGTECTDGQPDL